MIGELTTGINPKALGLQNAMWTTLRVDGGLNVDHIQTEDFPTADPWSYFFRKTVAGLRDEGEFDGRIVTEFGAGDLRNLRILGGRISGFRAVEIDPERLRIGAANLVLHKELRLLPHDLIEGDAVAFLDEWREEAKGQIDGWVFMCLPQSPQGDNSADKYDPNAALAKYKDWDRYGLTLNVAVLDKLRQVASDDLNVLVVNSHRVSQEVRQQAIVSTGWSIASEYISPQIQQDPDTGIGWIVEAGIDDGTRFYERLNSGLLRPISAVEAELRRVEAVESGRGRQRFNVFHQLSFYHLRPNHAKQD